MINSVTGQYEGGHKFWAYTCTSCPTVVGMFIVLSGTSSHLRTAGEIFSRVERSSNSFKKQ